MCNAVKSTIDGMFWWCFGQDYYIVGIFACVTRDFHVSSSQKCSTFDVILIKSCEDVWIQVISSGMRNSAPMDNNNRHRMFWHCNIFDGWVKKVNPIYRYWTIDIWILKILDIDLAYYGGVLAQLVAHQT